MSAAAVSIAGVIVAVLSGLLVPLCVAMWRQSTKMEILIVHAKRSDEWMEKVDKRLEDGEKRMGAMERSISFLRGKGSLAGEKE